ncbi:MAG TPA: C40 family peptidase [Rhodanobacter sp.]|nr:C40 family peptidase [Rhodanobacter sp.]
MSIKQPRVVAALVLMLLCGALQARTAQPEIQPVVAAPLVSGHDSPLLQTLSAFNPGILTGPSTMTGVGASSIATAVAAGTAGNSDEDQASNVQSATGKPAADSAVIRNVTDLRKALLAAAMGLRDIRYVRGGHDPLTGFDCSGFVRYVFAHAVGMQLPNNAAGQFLAGLKVRRADMQPGDLVFFHTHGRHRISHVGIYISNGRFIHSPSAGKSVEISSLDNAYWAKRFAGAKRPEPMAMAAKQG